MAAVRYSVGVNQKHYLFISKWQIAAPLSLTWSVIVEPKKWRLWWLGLERVTVVEHKDGLLDTKLACVWRSKLGYKLELVITIAHYTVCKNISFNSSGDLSGNGSFSFSKNNDNTFIDIVWDVCTTKRWMNLLSFILRPIFVKNHDLLMKQGEEGLKEYMRKLE